MMSSIATCPACGELVTRAMQRCPACACPLRGGPPAPGASGQQSWQLLLDAISHLPRRGLDSRLSHDAGRDHRWMWRRDTL
jgi:hypothetical protein